MGAVCSAGMAGENAEVGGKSLGFSGKILKKGDSFTNRKDSDSRSNDQGRRQRNKENGFSDEFGLSTSASMGEKQISRKGSLLSKASYRAVEVLDSLGSGMPKLNNNSGFVSGMTSKGKKISILAFEVANTITKGAILFNSLYEENIQFLKKEVLQSEGIQQLVSTDMKELISLAEMDKREEFNVFSREVARFGNMCKDPQWHNLHRYFSRLDMDVLGDKQNPVDAEKTMQEFAGLVNYTAELYHELNAYERFQHDYQQKIKEMESLNLPLKGESITIFQSELKHQKKLVRNLKKKSLWARNLEEVNLMASNEDRPHDDDIDDGDHEKVVGQAAEIRRGITLMKKVIRDRDRGILLDAHWSESGLLIEPNGSKITSFIGALVRNAIPITCDEWRDEDLEEAKDKIWIEIQRSFNNMEDNRKQHCLRLAGRLLRGFRAFLTRKYLMDANKNFVDAEYPKRYKSLISPEEWVTFKAKRRDPKFQSRSKKNRQRASAPPYPYKKGRMGYGRLEQSILTRESSSETSVPPYVLWKEARVGKDGVVKEDVQKVFEKCETLSQSISPDEGNDCRSVLSRALDLPEYSGRVRGKGFGITPTSLKMKKQKAPSNKELQESLYALQAEVRELKREKELREQASGCKATSDKGSIGCNFQPDLPEGISPCQLYLSSPTYRMVGKGKVHNTLGELLHTRPLPTGCLKVSVDIALEKDALLPHPDDVSDATLVGDAIGSFVAWPSSLISVDDETPTKSKAKDKEPPRKIESVASIKQMHAKEIEDVSKGKKPEKVVAKTAAKKKPNPSRFRSCLLTSLEISNIPQGNTRLVPMEEDVFGIEHHETIGMEDFEQIFGHTQLGLGVIDTYIRFLYEKLMHLSGLRQRFAFLAPFITNLGLIISKPDEVMAYVLNRFMASINSEKLFFLPFNTGNGGHWLLVAINPISEVVYFLDSLHNPVSTYEAMKKLVDTIIQVFRAQRGSQVPKSKANNITWIQVECPGQRNEVDCGFYMLQFMKEILLSNQIEIPSKYFDEFKCATYSKSKLDELKEEWCQFMIELKVV